MAKIVIEDIKKDRRSLRDVLPSKKTHSERKDEEVEPASSISRRHRHDREGWGVGSFLVTTIIFAALVVILGYFVSPIFTKVTVAIEPKEVTVPINETLKFGREATSQLPFAVLPAIEKTITTTAPATGSKNVSTKATGKIRISNNFSEAVQQLVANTRFATADGKIYRITQTVNVPGIKNGQPGTLDVTVTADKPGSEYNIGLKDFTLPGLAGSPRFSKVTAKSITPMTGGSSGNVKAVDAATEKAIQDQLTKDLTAVLKAEVTKQLPEGFWAPEGISTFDIVINQVPDEGTANTNTATFKATGKVESIIIPLKSLTQFLATDLITDYQAGEALHLANIDSLKFSVDTLPADLLSAPTITLKIQGEGRFVWDIDTEKLTLALAGQPKEQYAELFSQFGSAVASSTVVFSPSWSSHFPDDQSRIKIELLTPR